MPSLAPLYTSCGHSRALLRVCLEAGQECPLQHDLQVRGKGQEKARRVASTQSGSVLELRTAKAGSLKTSPTSEITTLQHNAGVDVHNEDPASPGTHVVLTVFPLGQWSLSIRMCKCRFLGLTPQLLNQNLKVGPRNLHFGTNKRTCDSVSHAL